MIISGSRDLEIALYCLSPRFGNRENLLKLKQMKSTSLQEIEDAKKAALEVLLHNAHGPYMGLPRTAGWGYPEPYTRDLMFSIFGIAVSGLSLIHISEP